MTDFWNDEPLLPKASALPTRPTHRPSTPKPASTLPKRPSRGPSTAKPVSTPATTTPQTEPSPVVIGKKDERSKSVGEQLEQTRIDLAEAERLEDELLAKHGLGERKVYAGLTYGAGANSAVSAPALNPPTVARMPSIQALTDSKNVPAAEASPMTASEQFNPTQRDILILTRLNEVRRLTGEQLAFYFVALQKRPLEDIPRVAESLRKTNLLKLQNNGSIKKISPRGKATPFYILTPLGAAHVEYPLPVDHELLSDKFNHDSLDLLEHKEIANLASVMLQIRTGTILIEGKSGGRTKLFSPPAQPVVTQLQIADAASRVEAWFHGDINQFQRDASKAWKDLTPDEGGFPVVDNHEWNMTDMTNATGEDFTFRINQSFDVKAALRGQEVTQKVSPAWLFSTYTDDGEPEVEPLAHFVILQPNVRINSVATGKVETLSGSIVGRVESGRVLPQQSYQYTLWQLLRSNHGFAKCLIISSTPAIKEAVQGAWRDLIHKKHVPVELVDWVMFGDYEPLNSTRERLKQFSAPVANKPARTMIQG